VKYLSPKKMIVSTSMKQSAPTNYQGKHSDSLKLAQVIQGTSENNMTSKSLQVFKILDTDKFFPQKSGLQAIAADLDNQTVTNQIRNFSDSNTYRQKQIGTNFKDSNTMSPLWLQITLHWMKKRI
jgi:hypothetical protein